MPSNLPPRRTTKGQAARSARARPYRDRGSVARGSAGRSASHGESGEDLSDGVPEGQVGDRLLDE